jgi:nanoRNase/pAp phosphatase (c-di-AMP/oligoRNAs hydrolase)
MANELTEQVINPINQHRLMLLKETAGSGPVLILTHDNPDPDALASGKALLYLLWEAWGIPGRLLYSGLVARAENQAMLRNLAPEWEHTENPNNLASYSAVALVDTQPSAGNNRFPDERLPDIVIDHHHPIRESLQKVPYIDMRPEIGATVSLLFQHLEAANIQPDPILATAMFYGLQTDTQGLARGASPVDQNVYFKLLNMLDAEMADLLIRLNDMKAVLCIGFHEHTLYLSLRTEPSGIDAGNTIQKIILPPGKAGGHGTMAGGQINLTDQDIDALVNQITERFLSTMSETGSGKPMLDV